MVAILIVLSYFRRHSLIRVYYLKSDRIDKTDTVKGIEYIHNAILDVEGALNKLIQDTTDAEHIELSRLAEIWRNATDEEKKQFQTTSYIHDAPAQTKDLAKEIDTLKARLEKLEKQTR